MKRNKRIRLVLGLLVLGIGLLSFGFVQTAEFIQEDMQAEEVAAQISSVPSLKRLALNYIGKKKIEGNEQLFGKFKELLVRNNMLFGELKKDITCEVAKIAALEYAKLNKRIVSPLNQYKETNPALGILIDKQRVEYSLSIQDLMDAGAIIQIRQGGKYNVKFLYFANLSLTSLNGLQEVANLLLLEELYLEDNHLKELKLENMPLLEKVALSDNHLKELVVANLPLLLLLCLDRNQLQELALENLPALVKVDLSWNQLKKLKLANLPLLEFLYLQNNQLKELKLANLIFLAKVDLSYNQLKELTVPNLPLLRELYLQNNQLEKLKLENMSLLKKVDISCNQLKELTIVNLPSLQFLYLQNNELTEKSQRVLRGLRIQYLYLNDQRVPYIEELNEEPVRVSRLQRVRRLVVQAAVRAHDVCVIS